MLSQLSLSSQSSSRPSFSSHNHPISVIPVTVGQQTSEIRHQTSDIGPRKLDVGHGTWDMGLGNQTSDIRHATVRQEIGQKIRQKI